MVQDHTRRLRRAIERHAREHPLGEDYVMSTDTDIIIALAHKLDHENTRLRAENAALRAGQGAWPDGDDSPAGEQVPRVIDTRDLEAGQWVAWDRYQDGQWQAGKVEAWQPTGQLRVLGDFVGHMKADRRFILLEDAPTSDDDDRRDARVTAETIRQSELGSTWEDRDGGIWEWTGVSLRGHKESGGLGGAFRTREILDYHGPLTRSTAAPRGTYPKRLTVEDLDAAGVGSQLEIKSTVFIKTAKGGWSTYNDGVVGYPSEYMIRNGWGAATLTYPERGDDE